MSIISESVDPGVALFRSLGDPARLAILRRLTFGEVRVAELTEELGLAQSTVSSHISCLKDCGLVDGRMDGRRVYYSLARPELLDLLAAAEVLLAATGNAVALCPNYGTDSIDQCATSSIGATASATGDPSPAGPVPGPTSAISQNNEVLA